MSATTRVLLRGGVILTGVGVASAMALEGERIVWVGEEAGSVAFETGGDVVELNGRLVTPAFVDAHVHTVQTGRQLDGLDLGGTRSRSEVLERLSAYAARTPSGQVLVGAGWDETDWPDRALPTAEDVERAAPGRSVYLSRVDGHSAIISPALLRQTPGVEAADGYSASGRLERRAKHLVSDRLGDLIGPQERLAAARRAVSAMAAKGIGAFHENAAPHIGPEDELALVRQAGTEAGLDVTLYWGELEAFDKVERLGVAGLAGDLVADGALGSRTAALRAPYSDSPTGCGHGYLTAEQITRHVVGCTQRGLQAGFHCIGDAALDAIAEGFERAAEQVGVGALRAARHRLEHCEMPSAAAVDLFATLGVVASVQPMFDGLWGGEQGMYAERLGERWRTLNPFAQLHAAGVALAFGSDAPVTAPDPWLAIRAAVLHRTDTQRLPAEVALAAHTRGGWQAAGLDGRGTLEAGAEATYAVWDARGFPDFTEGDCVPRAELTVVRGRVVHRDWHDPSP